MKILFFIETLFLGGKERRILELIKYLKGNTDYTLGLVITEPLIHFEAVYDLGIEVKIMERKYAKYDPLLFIKFYRYCRIFNPDIIHTWGRMTTFYSIPTKLIRRIPLISSLVADAQKNFGNISINNFFHYTDTFFSDAILSNSDAGLIAYRIRSPKAKVIRNGVNLKRFQQQFDTALMRKELGITTDFVVVMVAAFSKFKDYDLFLDVAKEIGKMRDDVTFIGVGDGPQWIRIKQRVLNEKLTNVLLTGKKINVEAIIAATDIGILCTNCEGISNSIIEYMALGKPVISTDIIGGSKELIVEGVTGYCIERSIEKIVPLINLLLDNIDLRISLGNSGIQRISSHFSIRRMGEDFINLYDDILAQKKR